MTDEFRLEDIHVGYGAGQPSLKGKADKCFRGRAQSGTVVPVPGWPVLPGRSACSSPDKSAIWLWQSIASEVG